MSGYYSIDHLVETDSDVKKNLASIESGRAPPSEEALEKTIEALKAKGFLVDVVEKGSDVIEFLSKTIPSGSSIHNSGSTTLYQIGYFGMDKEKLGWDDLNAKVIAEKDQVKSSKLRQLASTADYFITSPAAVSEDGELVLADLSGTKVGPVNVAGKTIFVTPFQKIVKSYDDAIKRVYDVAFQLESARAKLAYGVQGSIVANILSLKHSNVMQPGKFHVLIVKEVLGF